MINRRKFILGTALASFFSYLGIRSAIGTRHSPIIKQSKTSSPMVISTWNHGLAANDAAWEVIQNEGKSIDAVEAGVRIPEGDPEVSSVGYGGLPDRDGKVTLDACIMDEKGNCGSVSFLQNIKHPISVARMVMEKTPHVMLSGAGALKFALSNGFKEEVLLSDKARDAWKTWIKTSKYTPIINKENHDTIGLLAIDKKGNLSGACTTSGLAWKVHGRVGDSPIIGAGMYVDNEVGGAVATGLGEAVLKTLGTFLIVELMRNGRSPQEACKEAVNRIAAKQNAKNFQVGYLAINKSGEHGAYSINKGFNYAIHQNGKNELVASKYLMTDDKSH